MRGDAPAVDAEATLRRLDDEAVELKLGKPAGDGVLRVCAESLTGIPIRQVDFPVVVDFLVEEPLERDVEQSRARSARLPCRPIKDVLGDGYEWRELEAPAPPFAGHAILSMHIG